MKLWATWSTGKAPSDGGAVGNRWSLRSLPIQTSLWSYDYQAYLHPHTHMHPLEEHKPHPPRLTSLILIFKIYLTVMCAWARRECLERWKSKHFFKTCCRSDHPNTDRRDRNTQWLNTVPEKWTLRHPCFKLQQNSPWWFLTLNFRPMKSREKNCMNVRWLAG